MAGRQALLDALRQGGAFEPGRYVSHVSHVCNLRVGREILPVVDVQELVKGANTPRGVNSILVLGSSLTVVRRVEYSTQRPLFCHADRLYVRGDLTVDGIAGEGNELQFAADGRLVGIRFVEANDLPAPAAGTPLSP